MDPMRVALRVTLAVAFSCFPVSSGRAGEPLHATIDRLIGAGAGGPLAGESDDAEFLRRASLDFAGVIPEAGEVRAFLRDTSADKRVRLLERLLASEAFAAHWADRLTVMLLERQDLGKVDREEWRRFLVRSLQGAPRWDRMVREMIAARGVGEARPAMKFLGAGDHHRMTEGIARLLLGMDLECARCHDHPSVEEWKQADYWGLFAYLNQTKAVVRKSDGLPFFAEGLAAGKVGFQSVFSDEKEATGPKLPGRPEVPVPRLEKGAAFERPAADGLPAVPVFRPRELLAAHLASADTPLFARNAANRIWFLLMGRGLAHPLDQMHGENPPSHPELLDRLAGAFAASGFDLKWLLREIAASAAYQRGSRVPGGAGESDGLEPERYRSALPKPLSPEQLLHATLTATGNLGRVRALKAAPGSPPFDRRGYFTGTNPELPPSFEEVRAVFVQTFGQPPGRAEVEFTPGLNQALFLMNDRLILHWLSPQEGNLVDRLRRLETPAAVAEELYLSVLGRFPEEAERAEVAAYLNQPGPGDRGLREDALADLAWALLNSAEFRLNH